MGTFTDNHYVYFSDYLNSVIRIIDASGIIHTFAGTGSVGYSGDGGPATAAQLGNPRTIALDYSGNMYLTDYENNVIRKINTSGTISTIAGTGAAGYSGDGGPASLAHLYRPYGVVTDGAGNVYFSEQGNHTVRKINTSGTISAFAGNGVAGYSGDWAEATFAHLYQPMGIAIDATSNVYIADDANFVVRMVGVFNRAPFFDSGLTQNIAVCENSATTDISNLLSVTDFDATQSLTWTSLAAPANGTISVGYSATATGAPIMPSGLNYTPNSGFSGTDSFTVQVSDGRATGFTKIIVTVNPLPVAGSIAGPVNVCTGLTIALTDTANDGTWSSADTTIATISNSGVVTGVAAGSVVISYNSNLTCGTSGTSATINVLNHPAATITSAPNICIGHTTNIVFAGTSGATLTYSADSAAGVDTVLTGGTFTLTTAVISANHNYTLVSVRNAGCTTTIDTTVTVGPLPAIWVGGTTGKETDWNTASNWYCGDVPYATDNVVIPSGTTYQPAIAASGTGNALNISIASGVALTVNTGAHVNVKGTITNNGTIAGAGIMSLNGVATQRIQGNGTYNNLEINDTAGAAIDSAATVLVKNTLTVTAGTFNTRDSLTLASDSNTTARIAAIPATGASITGNVKVNQYVPGGYRRYRFWSHPFSNYIELSQIEKCIDVTGQGGASNGFTTTGTNAPSAYRYNPIYGNSSLASDPGWMAYTSAYGTVDTNRLHKYQSIRLFYRGAKGQGLTTTTGYTISPTVICMKGTVNQGTQVVSLAKGATTDQDYNMVGNPYASPVDIGTIVYNAKAAGNINGSAFYVFNPFLGAGGQFQAISIDGSHYYLQANCGFQVRAAHNGDTLRFTENDKSSSITTDLLRAKPEFVTLYVYDANYHPWDILNVKFNEAATENEDNNYDAGKPIGTDFNFYSLSADNQKLAIDQRPYVSGKAIPLGISSNFSNKFIIRAEGVELPEGAKLYLHDKLLSKYTELLQGAEYKFDISAEANTQGENRFELTTEPATIAAATTRALQVSMTPNPATEDVKINFNAGLNENVSIRVMDVTGLCVYNKNLGVQESGSISVPLSSFAAGMYMVELTAGGQKVVQKLVKE